MTNLDTECVNCMTQNVFLEVAFSGRKATYQNDKYVTIFQQLFNYVNDNVTKQDLTTKQDSVTTQYISCDGAGSCDKIRFCEKL